MEQSGISRDYWTVQWLNKEQYKPGEEICVHIHNVDKQTGNLQGVFI